MTNRITVEVGDLLFDFGTFNIWVNSAQWKFQKAGVSSKNVLCVDQRGRILQKGIEFQRAKIDNAFPVNVYRALI